ncbi:MAG: hypothetical protein K1060chlam2_01022 [Chlamydiae bacterium]|nr:hypothetical protein [Chlamydiota bacterium]
MNDERKKANLEQEKRRNPLNLKWLKIDYLTPPQATLIYYGIEPSRDDSRNMQIIQAVDFLGVLQVLTASEFILVRLNAIRFPEFVAWLEEKGFEIPSHLESMADTARLQIRKDAPLKGELLELDTRTLRPEQRFKFFLRCWAGDYWKLGGNISASELVECNNDFKKTRSDWENRTKKKYDDDTIKGWISDMSPKSKKNVS